MEYIKIGNIKIKKTAALAPMASVADRAYRQICKSFGASFVVGEMVSSRGMFYNDRKTSQLLEVTPLEHPMAVQLFGDDPKYMAMAAEKALKYNPQIIDINMGCPVPKVAGNGSGCALMKNPELACKIAKAVLEVSTIPVTVKIRKGWDEKSANAVEFAKMMEQSGVAAITIHGRTKQQNYSGKADWNIIKEVKQAVKVPVIGNGDVFSAQAAKQMYDQTGVDLVMVGRGSYGRPWLFSQIEHYLETGELQPDPPLEQKIQTMQRHIELICKYKGEYIGMKEARKHAAWYLKGISGAAQYRKLCFNLENLDQLKDLSKQIVQKNS